MKQKYILWLLAIAGLASLIAVYSNHFHNGFHFDDSHSIESNFYIRDLKNIPLFFKDATTISSLPQNQSYRPMMPVLYAIDYKLAGGLDPFYFHLTTFIWYVLQLVLMYLLFVRIFERAASHQWNKIIALCGVLFYAFHTANAETINYISARSDSISTFFFLAAMVMFSYLPRTRKFGLYLIPLIIGVLVKPVAIVFPGMLIFYVLFFETGFSFEKVKEIIKGDPIFTAINASILSIIICGGLYYFQGKMTPSTFVPGGSVYNYLITQPFVILHYFQTFFVPTGLSADTDWRVLDSFRDVRFFVGMLFIFIMLAIVWVTAKKKHLQPIAFGIIWFFIALVPSSSIIPFAEVLNDHRIFFPFVGLTLSVAWVVRLWLVKNEDQVKMNVSFRSGIAAAFLIVLSLHAYGVRERNKVWFNDESLWYDVTIKSPLNGRGLMNYGLTLMNKAKYDEAEAYFKKALEILPKYSYLYVNMAILKNAQGKVSEAEENYKKGIMYTGNASAEPYYFYAEFLHKKGRSEEALQQLNAALNLVPGHIYSRYLLMEIFYAKYDWDKLKETAEATLKINAQDQTAQYYLTASQGRKTKLDLQLEAVKNKPSPDGYLGLSLEYYNAGMFEKCIEAAYEAIKLKPNFPEAYNNICSAYNQMGKWKEAEQACGQALKVDPGYQLAKNNLSFTLQRKQRIEAAEKKALAGPATARTYLDLGIVYYYDGFYEKCIEAARKALGVDPKNAEAYNVICSALNSLKRYEEAIGACNMAIKLQPDFQLAKNNLAFAKMKLGK